MSDLARSRSCWEARVAVEIEVLADADAVARRAAALVAEQARAAAAARGRFALALSGGSTPWQMLRVLAREDVPWKAVHVFQVDERVAPAGHPDRNLTHIRDSLLGAASLPPGNLHAMPVEDRDLVAAAARYARALEAVAGAPPVLDLVHLGLGPDGHTASLVPGDRALGMVQAEVTVTAEYQGHRRMTLTYPAIGRARRILWLVTGEEKAPMLARLRAGDSTIPAGRVRRERSLILADAAAAGGAAARR
jgi:6-phosphogluconolactonase